MINFDATAFPLFAGMPYSETILGPGDSIYIPRWTWHFVVAIDAPSARIRWQELYDDAANPIFGSSSKGSSNTPSSGANAVVDIDGKKAKRKNRGKGATDNEKEQEEEEVPHCFSISFWWGDRREKDSTSTQPQAQHVSQSQRQHNNSNKTN